MPENEITCDAIVDYGDAVTWVRELYPVPLDELSTHLVNLEPAVVGAMLDLCRRLEDRLRKSGVDVTAVGHAGDSLIRAGLIGAELMRRGYRQFIATSEVERTEAGHG